MMTADQVIAAQKANVETLFNLTSTAFSSIEKLVELNIAIARSTLVEAAENTQSALSVKDAQELIALQANLMQPFAEKAMVYGRQLYEIASNTQAEFNKVAENKTNEAQHALATFVENASKNAPAGSEATMALVKTAMATANNTVESIQKASKQALNMVEANYDAVSKSVASATQQAANSARARSAAKK